MDGGLKGARKKIEIIDQDGGRVRIFYGNDLGTQGRAHPIRPRGDGLSVLYSQGTAAQYPRPFLEATERSGHSRSTVASTSKTDSVHPGS